MMAAHTTNTPTALHAFGNKAIPRPPRDSDLVLDKSGTGMLEPQVAASAHGASTFGDPAKAPLTGHYHALATNTALPTGVAVVADGSDVGGTALETHHTIYPTEAMTPDDFRGRFAGLAWAYAGSKK